MATVRSIVNLGHGLRKRHEVKVRQPLTTLTVVSRDPDVVAAVTSHRDLIAEELNVGAVVIDAVEDHLVHLSAQANFKLLGPRLGAATKAVAAAIAELPHEAISAILDGNTVELGGNEIGVDDIIVHRDPRAGLVVAADGPISVALDVTVTPELAVEGTAREIISAVQGIRRDQGLEVSDRITLAWQSDDDTIAAAMSSHGDLIAGELLATRVSRADEPQQRNIDINEATISVTVERA
jgi:isoleucyl-tRNA synthetase